MARLKENLLGSIGLSVIFVPFVWLFLCIIASEWFFNWWGFLSLLIIGIVVGVCLALFTPSSSETTQKIYDEIEKEKSDIATKYDMKYGGCTKSVIVNGNSHYNLRVYEESRILIAYAMKDGWLQYVECPFCDMISCELNGETFAPTTKIESNNTKIVGRAVAGAAIAGPVGAIIGGITTPNKTVSSFGGAKNDVCIYMNNINNPLVRIPFGAWEQEAMETFATIKAILNKYGTKSE